MECRVVSNLEPEKHVEKLLSEKDLVELIGLSRITLWRKVRAQEFPPPRKISVGRKAWLESEVSDLISTRPVANAYRSVDASAT